MSLSPSRNYYPKIEEKKVKKMERGNLWEGNN